MFCRPAFLTAIAAAIATAYAAPLRAEPLLKSAFEGFHAGLLQDIKAQGQSVPRSVAVGDLNGDGRPDFVVATPGNTAWEDSANVISVHLANPVPQTVQPPYLPATLYTTGTGPQSVALVDMNHDALLDVVTANFRGMSVSVLLGDGAGHLGPPIHAAVGGLPRSVAVADLNGDTHPDVVVTNQSANTISVLLGLGNGALSPRVDYATQVSPFMMALARLNGDAAPDLVVGCGDAVNFFLSVHINNGSGGFAARTDIATAQPPFSVAAGMLNADGAVDLVVGWLDPGPVTVYLGTGTGSFSAPVGYGPPVLGFFVLLDDVNGDSKTDVIASTPDGTTGDNDIAVLLGDGAGGLGSPSYYDAGPSALGIACADLDADGDRDLVTAGGGSYVLSSGHTISVLRNNGSGTFGTGISQDAGLSPNYSVSADFNRDGILDVATTGASPFGVALHPGIGNGTFAAPSFIALADSGLGIGAADIDGNGTADLIVSTSSQILYLRGTGFGSFVGPFVVAGAERFDGELADVNLDGKPDLITFSGTNVLVRLGAGTGTFGSATTVPAFSAVRGVRSGDVDRNARVDLIISTAAGIVVRSGAGNGTFPTATTNLASHSFNGKPVVADLNLDGIPDVAVGDNEEASSPTVGMTVFLGTGTTTLGSSVTYPTLDTPLEGAAADMNRDGKLDLLVANAAFSQRPGTVSVLEGNGSGTFSANTDYGAGRLGGRPLMGDYDRDGRPDVAVTTKAFQGNGRLKVLRGNAPGTFGTYSPKTDYTGQPGDQAVAIEDVNRDGHPDAIVLGSTSLAVSLGDGLGGLGAPISTSLGGTAHGMAVADLSFDGIVDIAVIVGEFVRVLLGSGTGTFALLADQNVTGTTPTAIAVGDVTHDGIPDLVTANEGSEDIGILVGLGAGLFIADSFIPTEPGPQSLSLVDVDRNGWLDIVTANRSTNNVWAHLNEEGFFNSLPPVAVGLAPTSIAAGDFNRDGKPDVAVTHETAGVDQVAVLLNNVGFGSPFLAPTDYPLPNGPRSVAVSDVDRDGDDDLVVGSFGFVSVLMGSGTGTFSPRADYAAGTLAASVATGDFNLDGRPDILACNFPTPIVHVYLNTGSVITGVEGPAPAAPSPTRLVQNTPNPFNPRTTIRFHLEAPGRARLMVFDVSGRLVATLVERNLPAGEHRVDWDGRDDAGRPVASGVYFQRLEAPGFSDSRTMVLLK